MQTLRNLQKRNSELKQFSSLKNGVTIRIDSPRKQQKHGNGLRYNCNPKRRNEQFKISNSKRKRIPQQ